MTTGFLFDGHLMAKAKPTWKVPGKTKFISLLGDPHLFDRQLIGRAQTVTLSLGDYFEAEVLPHVEDAWINPDKRDARDSQIGLVGYEINFNRYFYQYVPPRPLAEIDAELKQVEREIAALLAEVAE